MIENIDIDRIVPHPDNPRKDLGDLTELAESIKTNGILQNLTVVPMDDNYNFRAIIGHRRLAAAKLAGLTEVPCAIADMDPKQQVATMLLENMQRSDLTLWEQAQGIQMMLDFGETIGDVAKRTGFSWGTIRRRVKLLELDPEKFKASMERGASLLDYAELDKIQDKELKNSVLEKIGTSDFKWKLKSVLDQEERQQKTAAIIGQLEQFAEQVESTDGLQFIRSIELGATDIEIPEDADEKKYYFCDRGWGVALYAERDQNDLQGSDAGNNESAERYKKQQERVAQLKEIQERATQLRDDFVRDFQPKKQHTQLIMEFAVRAFFNGEWYLPDADFLSLLNIELPEADDGEEEEITFDTISDKFAKDPEKVLFVTAYHTSLYAQNTGGGANRCFNWRGEYQKNDTLQSVYDVLEKLGYEISAEERAYLDGTHELFARDEVAHDA